MHVQYTSFANLLCAMDVSTVYYLLQCIAEDPYVIQMVRKGQDFFLINIFYFTDRHFNGVAY